MYCYYTCIICIIYIVSVNYLCIVVRYIYGQVIEHVIPRDCREDNNNYLFLLYYLY